MDDSADGGCYVRRRWAAAPSWGILSGLMGKVIKAKLVSKTFPDGKEYRRKDNQFYPENGSLELSEENDFGLIRCCSWRIWSVNSLWCPEPAG